MLLHAKRRPSVLVPPLARLALAPSNARMYGVINIPTIHTYIVHPIDICRHINLLVVESGRDLAERTQPKLFSYFNVVFIREFPAKTF